MSGLSFSGGRRTLVATVLFAPLRSSFSAPGAIMWQPETLFHLSCAVAASKHKRGVIRAHARLKYILPPSLLCSVIDCVPFSLQETLLIYCVKLSDIKRNPLYWNHYLTTLLLPSESRRTDEDTLRWRRSFGQQ
jgi:hypothetical protein